jgi:hypothetical protein
MKGGFNTDPELDISLDRFFRAITTALDPETILHVDLENIRNVLRRGHLALGYGRASLSSDGAVLQACLASLRCESLTSLSAAPMATEILIIMNSPWSAAVKLIEVREGLRAISLWGENDCGKLHSQYTMIHNEESAGDAIEVYLFVAR